MNYSEMKLKMRPIVVRWGEVIDKIPMFIRVAFCFVLWSGIIWGLYIWHRTPEQMLSLRGNPRTKIYHAEHCPNYPQLKRYVTFSSYEDAESRGYRMAKNCK